MEIVFNDDVENLQFYNDKYKLITSNHEGLN